MLAGARTEVPERGVGLRRRGRARPASGGRLGVPDPSPEGKMRFSAASSVSSITIWFW